MPLISANAERKEAEWLAGETDCNQREEGKITFLCMLAPSFSKFSKLTCQSLGAKVKQTYRVHMQLVSSNE